MLRKIILMLLTLGIFNVCFADTSLTVIIPTAYVSRIVEMLNARYPKQNGETTVQQGQRATCILIRNELREYENNRDLQNAINGVNVSTDVVHQ